MEPLEKKKTKTVKMDYSLNHLRNYFLEHPAIDLARIEDACSLPKDTLRHFVKDRRGVASKHIRKLESELFKYGYIPMEA